MPDGAKRDNGAPGPLRFTGDVIPVIGVGIALIFFCTIYYYHGRKVAFHEFCRFFSLTDGAVETWGGVFQCCSALLLLLAPALLLAVFVLKIPLKQMGLALGDWKWGLKVSLPIIILMVPLIILTQGEHTGLCTVYPLSPFAGESISMFAIWAACYLVYYIAWEGLFRGVMQLGLQTRLGLVQAMLIQTALTTLLHAGSPEFETFAALAAGPVLGYMALRTRSILYVTLIHFAAGLATDLSCILRSW